MKIKYVMLLSIMKLKIIQEKVQARKGLSSLFFLFGKKKALMEINNLILIKLFSSF